MKGCGYANEAFLAFSLSLFFNGSHCGRPSLVPFRKVTSAADCPRTMALFLLGGRAGWESGGEGRGSQEKAPPWLVSISQQAAETKIEIALGTAAGGLFGL